jgi:hypothetical protein
LTAGAPSPAIESTSALFCCLLCCDLRCTNK